MIDEQPTTPMPVIRRVVYPRPAWQSPAFLARLICLLLLIGILAASGMTFFSTPHTWRLPYEPTPTPTYANCAQETIFWTGTAYVTQINEVC